MPWYSQEKTREITVKIISAFGALKRKQRKWTKPPPFCTVYNLPSFAALAF